MHLLISLRRLALLCGTLLVLNNCAGYQLGSSKPGKMQDIQKLAIPVFKNNTLEPRSSVLVTNNVVRQFQLDGTYQIVDERYAQAVLRGTIRDFQRRQLRSARNNTLRTRELELRIFVDYTVEEPGTGVVLARGSVDGSTSVFLDPNFQLSERQAIDDAAHRLAEELVSRLTEGWGADSFPEQEEPRAPSYRQPGLNRFAPGRLH